MPLLLRNLIEQSNAKLFAQLKFSCVHFAVVGFVVVTAEVQEAVQYQLLDLIFERQPVFLRLTIGLLDRDHDVTQIIHRIIKPVGFVRE